jgi:hypothetical protein
LEKNHLQQCTPRAELAANQENATKLRAKLLRDDFQEHGFAQTGSADYQHGALTSLDAATNSLSRFFRGGRREVTAGIWSGSEGPRRSGRRGSFGHLAVSLNASCMKAGREVVRVVPR